MTTATAWRSSAELRASLDHPVIDADCHTIEYLPGLEAHLRDYGVVLDLDGRHGEGIFLDAGLGFSAATRSIEVRGWAQMTRVERAAWRPTRPPWWAFPTRDPRDVATTKFPGLMYERLEEFGIDFAVVYPTLGLGFPHVDDPDLRVAACRGLNAYHAEIFGPYRDRIIPVAVIASETPQQALEELEHAVLTQGFKVVLIASYNKRPIPGAVAAHPEAAPWAFTFDTYGVDSAYDYDPFWQRCVELGVPVSTHSASMGRPHRRSPSSYMFNSTGSFAEANHDICKSLFLGGVTRRFPRLRIGFLEGGVAWACALYADLVGRWSKRNGEAVQNYNPANIDAEAFARLVKQYAPARVVEELADLDAKGGAAGALDEGLQDDFAALAVQRVEELRDLFTTGFAFGCEADDPMTACAFRRDVNPFGARLRTLFGSDIGHWDVPEFASVLLEAWEPVEHGWLTESEFRDFVFGNQARFYVEADPDFFRGTVIEAAVTRALG